jgi:hypothetical protein
MRLMILPIGVLLIVGCSSPSNPAAEPAVDAASADVPVPAAMHSIVAKIALTPDADGKHVTFPTQNGSTVQLALSDVVGKTVYWATAPGGDNILNVVMPLDEAMTTVGTDLTATFTTEPHYADGPYEVACVISVTGSPMVPSAGDLAAFDNTPPPAGDPPDTGVSVRVHVEGADADLTLTNRYFIRFGTP